MYSDSVLHDILVPTSGCESDNLNQSPEFPSKIGDFPTGENSLYLRSGMELDDATARLRESLMPDGEQGANPGRLAVLGKD